MKEKRKKKKKKESKEKERVLISYRGSKMKYRLGSSSHLLDGNDPE
jgi:hypothetical protein